MLLLLLFYVPVTVSRMFFGASAVGVLKHSIMLNGECVTVATFADAELVNNLW